MKWCLPVNPLDINFARAFSIWSYVVPLFLVDIDECQDKKDNACENANCTNTEGSYACNCWKGYEYNTTAHLNRTCIGKF